MHNTSVYEVEVGPLECPPRGTEFSDGHVT